MVLITYSWNSWKTPGILNFLSGPKKNPGILKFSFRAQKNPWNFEIFFQGPGKLLEKQMIPLYSWKKPGKTNETKVKQEKKIKKK